MEKEIWKDVVGYESIYQVSNLGNVKSFKKDSKGKLLVLRERKGYLDIKLYKVGIIKRDYAVHRLVAIAFIPNLENKPQVNHKDGIKSNNQLSNLEWTTPSENASHAFRLNLLRDRRGEANNNVKLKTENIKFIRSNKDKFTGNELAKMFNVSPAEISKIKSYNLWQYV